MHTQTLTFLKPTSCRWLPNESRCSQASCISLWMQTQTTHIHTHTHTTPIFLLSNGAGPPENDNQAATHQWSLPTSVETGFPSYSLLFTLHPSKPGTLCSLCFRTSLLNLFLTPLCLCFFVSFSTCSKKPNRKDLLLETKLSLPRPCR